MLYTALITMLSPLINLFKYINNLLFYILLVIFFAFTGCSKNRDVVVPEVKVVYIHIPKMLLRDDIKTPTPPIKEEYIKAGPLAREKLLSKYVVELLGTAGLYKSKLTAIMAADTNMSNIVSEKQIK